METIQKNKLTMSMAVRDYLLPNSTITSPLPNFTANFTIVQSNIIQIQAFAELQDFEKTGIADSKEKLKDLLSGLSGDYSRKLVAYSKFNNNDLLLKEIKISESELKRIADVDLKTKAQELYDRAQANLAALTTYGITAATQTSFQNAITAFNASIPKPRLGIDEKKQATQQLAVLFKALDSALENIDLAIEIVRLTQVNFYNGYKTARKLILTGRTTLAVKGQIIDAKTGEPVQGAKIEFCTSDQLIPGTFTLKSVKTVPILTKKTAKKGGIMVKTLPSGSYQVRVKKVGYADVVTTLNINDNEMSLLNVELTKD